MNKYELTAEFIEVSGRKLFRIKALRNFSDVEAGDLGGFVESEKNLSQDGDCWVSGNAQVYENARVYEKAWVYGNVHLKYGRTTFDVKTNLPALIANSLNLGIVNGEILFYKRVRKTDGRYWSQFAEADPLEYKIGETVEIQNPNLDWEVSCGSGIHGSTYNYYTKEDSDHVIIALRAKKEDIITCQEGKIRCRKVFVVGECE